MARLARAPSAEVHGVLAVDKPEGPTSHDLVAGARRLYGTRAVGHAGTLDPMATGVLLLLFGEATKLSGYLLGEDKRYRAEISFGRSTDTLDALGRVTEEASLAPDWLAPGALEAALDAERARAEQLPPAFSAIKLAGEPAHRRARRGDPPELAPRAVRVRALELVARSARRLEVELTVEKGYYVRSFARDLGARLGVPSHLSRLRRLASGDFRVEDAIPWPPPEPVAPLPVAEAARRCLGAAELTPAGAARARLGPRLAREDF
ncbi:MAG: tRNA pseudouridine(55) synthase TruB, partial [Sorangiineae bacterium]|nr:tRNA pseudouridine(55) synthase TruB [Sorangiineae bacterium]